MRTGEGEAARPEVALAHMARQCLLRGDGVHRRVGRRRHHPELGVDRGADAAALADVLLQLDPPPR